jgi:hypothetical protein
MKNGFRSSSSSAMFCFCQRAVWVALWLWAAAAHADNWNYWGQVLVTTGAGPKLATDGTNIFYSTILDGVYRATLANRNFSLMPMTGFPLWDANTNTNGFAVANIATTPLGTIVISGSQISVSSNTITFNPPGSSANTLPVFYWWDETNQLWHAATITGKTYPYTGNVGNFSIAPDGSLWTCSGFYPYAYHSKDGGHSYTAFDINARVPTNYLPMPSGQTTFGEVFSILAGWNNQIVIGTETGGFLHSTNNGTNWTSLDPNFTSTNSINPLGRIGDARIAGLDHCGNFLLNNYLLMQFPGYTNWNGVALIGWRPADGLYFPATNGFLANLGTGHIITPPSGVSFCFMNQNYLLQGGIYRSPDGKNWSQFNQGSGLDFPFAPGLTNALGAGGCIMALSNLVFIGTGGGTIYTFDSSPPPILNRPPVALPLNLTCWENTPTNITLAGSDADGDALNFTFITTSSNCLISGSAPNLTITPTNNFTGLIQLAFVVDDGVATSKPAFLNIAVDSPTNTLSIIALTNPVDGNVYLTPTNLTLAANASDPDGLRAVNFYADGSLIASVTNAPYVLTLTNVAAGDHTFSARAIDHFGARTWSAPVRVTVLPVAARLTIRQVDSENVAVTWPLDLDGFFVESASDLDGPWTLSPVPPLFFTNGQTATIPLGDRQFFRLMHPH